MADVVDHPGIRDEDFAPAPAPEAPVAQGVHIGTGGDPLIVGLPIFAIGSLALGLALIDFVPAAAISGIVPIIFVGTGLYQLVVTVWSIFLGQTIVAGIFGTFSGFWLSLSALLLGLDHNWYKIPAANVVSVEELFFLCWACLFFFLIFPCLKLPAIYPAIVAIVVLALVLFVASLFTGSVALVVAAGCSALTFAFLGFYSWVAVGFVAMGFKRIPPLGTVIGARM
ncbi:MAG: GPR1/FUN34/YaaH family transporter [Acidimicrobiales bacterium]